MSALILASASTVRARLLKAAGVDFAVVPARIDEDSVKASLLADSVDSRGIADALAEMKALRVSASHPGALVLGADQVLMFDGALLSKAENMEAAASQLRRLRGRRHELIAALVLARDGTPIWRQMSIATLWMRAFSDEFLETYLKAEGDDILGSVGCYRLEAMGAQLFERIDGDYFSILGLPMLPLLAALRDQGIVAA